MYRHAKIDEALDGTMSQDFGYDKQSRLVSMYSANAVAGYGYDANGNRINTVDTSGARTTGYSATSNHLVSSTGADPQSYGYDALGNITTLGGATAYQYDAFNRMSAAGGMTYYVNPEGQRLRKTGTAGTSYFAPDQGGALLAEYSGGGWIDYLWLNGRLIGREVNGQLEAIHGDQLGRPQMVTNASQVVAWSVERAELALHPHRDGGERGGAEPGVPGPVPRCRDGAVAQRVPGLRRYAGAVCGE